MRTRNQLLMLAVSAGAVALLTNQTQAQYRVGEDGHALDSNTRVGSGGVNGPGRGSSGVSGNDVVVGNVTGGRQFRGGVDYTDPWAFRGNTAGRGVDAFVRDSAGVPSAYSPSFSLDTPRAFYGDSRGVVAPIGSAKIGSSGAYVGTSLQSSNPYSSSLIAAQTDTLLQNRIGSTQIVGYDQSLNSSILALPGSLNSSEPNMQSVLLATPLTGVVQVNGQNADNSFILNRYMATRRPGENLPQDLSEQSVQQMQQDLQVQSDSANGQSLNPSSLTGPQKGGANTGAKNGNGGQNGANAPIGADPIDAGQSISSNPIGTPIGSQQPIGSQGAASESFRRRLLVPPSRQSTQYAELKKRMDAYNAAHGISDEDANRQFRAEQRALGQGTPATGQKNNPGGTTRPVGPAVTPAGENPAVPEKTNLPPVKITSLADGVKAKGLHDLLASAEDLMRADKFASAIQKYNDAERVAPNNSFASLGRAHAELGAAYYGKAEADLRRVVALDPALLMAQFDLSAVMNAQRLAYVQKDLKDLAAKESRSERPWFLLAYIAYNTGDGAAAQYLDEAQKRSTVNDRVIQMMKSRWALSKPTTQPTPELNK